MQDDVDGEEDVDEHVQARHDDRPRRAGVALEQAPQGARLAAPAAPPRSREGEGRPRERVGGVWGAGDL